jgi:hypothetical protein
MSLSFRRNPDGTTTGRNVDTGFTVTDTDEEEVKRRLYEDAGWDYTPPPPPAPPGHHRFALVDDWFGDGGFDDARYASLRENPPDGCIPVDWGSFALQCERPGATLLGAVADEKPDEWFGEGMNGYKGEVGAHLLLAAVHRARLIGYGREDLLRLLDATGVE